MGFCQNCGLEIPDGAKFCMNCGAQIDWSILASTTQETIEEAYELQTIDNDLLSPIQGESKTFKLNGKELIVPKEMDIFNEYRMTFRSMAKKCSDNAVNEYLKEIHNLDDFLEKFDNIYMKNLEPLTKKAMDILIAEGIYTLTHEEFVKKHVTTYHNSLDVYDAVIDCCNSVNDTTSQIGEMFNDGFQSLTGRMIRRSNVQSEMVNNFLTGVAERLFENAMSEGSKDVLNQKKPEIYARILPHEVFNNIFLDYWCVFGSLIYLLKQNGATIYWPSKDEKETANRILQNLSNPSFNQDKLEDVLFDVVRMNPYNNEPLFSFMKEKYGETKEVLDIIQYFGDDLPSKIYSEKDYPVIAEIPAPVTSQQNANGLGTMANEVIDKLNIDTQAVKNVFKSATDSAVGKSLFSKFKK